MFNKIGTWFYNLLKKLMYCIGFIPEYQLVHELHDKDLIIAEHIRTIRGQESDIKQYRELRLDLEAEISQLKKRLDECDGWTISTIKKFAEQTEEYCKDTQTLLKSTIFNDTRWDFVKDQVSPGSTSIGKAYPHRLITDIYGKTVLLPETSSAIQDCSSLADKYTCALNQLAKYGTFTTIIRKLIDSGAMKMYLVYNAEHDQYELYWDIIAMTPNSQLFIVLEDPTGSVQAAEELIEAKIRMDNEEETTFLDLSHLYDNKNGAEG